MSTLESISEKLRIAAESLDSAAKEIRDLPFDPVAKHLQRIGAALGAIFEIQHHIYHQFPNLRPAYLSAQQPIPDPDLTDVQKALVAGLSQEQVDEVDSLLLSHATANWRKVAMLVGLSMMDTKCHLGSLPDVYFAQRVRNLVQTGRLESAGDLGSMRHSEVRLPRGKT